MVPRGIHEGLGFPWWFWSGLRDGQTRDSQTWDSQTRLSETRETWVSATWGSETRDRESKEWLIAELAWLNLTGCCYVAGIASYPFGADRFWKAPMGCCDNNVVLRCFSVPLISTPYLRVRVRWSITEWLNWFVYAACFSCSTILQCWGYCLLFIVYCV